MLRRPGRQRFNFKQLVYYTFYDLSAAKNLLSSIPHPLQNRAFKHQHPPSSYLRDDGHFVDGWKAAGWKRWTWWGRDGGENAEQDYVYLLHRNNWVVHFCSKLSFDCFWINFLSDEWNSFTEKIRAVDFESFQITRDFLRKFLRVFTLYIVKFTMIIRAAL